MTDIRPGAGLSTKWVINYANPWLESFTQVDIEGIISFADPIVHPDIRPGMLIEFYTQSGPGGSMRIGKPVRVRFRYHIEIGE